ncbi:MAG TPA: hypothetical protein VFO35_16795 [Steroidobacteraceae bacterium]|nr:hypothetical protein [Steroidobacteraceae bacterium]
MNDGAKGAGELRYWSQTIDGIVHGCWYRLRDDNQIEVFARGHRVVVPREAIALLPESVARTILTQLQARGEDTNMLYEQNGDASPPNGIMSSPEE